MENVGCIPRQTCSRQQHLAVRLQSEARLPVGQEDKTMNAYRSVCLLGLGLAVAFLAFMGVAWIYKIAIMAWV